ncbi:MAG: hypothetical protein VX966_04550 [Chloroflexota bacterium]|nr:hypothetical protein [Chloroflexota bacterium]
MSKLDIELLFKFFDLVIPQSGNMPSASEVITIEDVEKLLSGTHKYIEPLSKIADFARSKISVEAENEPADNHMTGMLLAMESTMASDFSMFVELIYLIYYSKGQVHEKINWDTDELAIKNRIPQFDDVILHNISQRPPFWRPA